MHQRKFAKALIPVAVGFALTAHPVLGGESAPRMQPNNSWISISGTVVNPTADRFALDYGSGMITVEVDDWDAYGEAHGLLDGDQVWASSKSTLVTGCPLPTISTTSSSTAGCSRPTS